MHFLWRLVLFITMLGTGLAAANDLLLIEARRLPQNCTSPLQCLPESQLILRNVAVLDVVETRAVMSFLNRISAVRGMTDDHIDTLNSSRRVISQKYHPSAVSDRQTLLQNHPGVFFDTIELDGSENTEGFSSYIQTQLSAAGVVFLTKEQWERTPGRPQLKVRFTARRESEGCIIPFAVSMSITEETLLVRNAELKVSSTIWSKTTRQNLANRNYTIQSALRENVEFFKRDWSEAQS